MFRRVTRPHGSSGVVKSKFRSNLPPRAFGASVRVVSFVELCSGMGIVILFVIDALSLEHLIFCTQYTHGLFFHFIPYDAI